MVVSRKRPTIRLCQNELQARIMAAPRARHGQRCFSFMVGCICMSILLLVRVPNRRTSREASVRPLFNDKRLPFHDRTKIRGSNSTSGNSTTKPTLVLHMGPPKTSSTYLQCILTNMIDTLALDNYNYLDLEIEQCKKTPIALARLEQQPQRHCYDIFAGKYDAKIDQTFLHSLDKALRQGRNAIIVNECFMFFTPSQTELLITTLAQNWNVRVIMNYRRAFEYLPSYYNEGEKPKEGHNGNPSLIPWPRERKRGVVGQHILPFDIENRGSFTWEFLRIEREGLHPVEETRQLYGRAFPDLTIIKLQDLDRTVNGEVVLQEMFCRILDLPHSCAAVQLDSTVEVAQQYKNSYYAFNYDVLATTAYTQKLFGFQKKAARKEDLPSRRDVAKLIQHYQEDKLNLTHHDFPMSCLSTDTMDRIINASLYSEKTLFSRIGWKRTLQDEADHRQAFVDYQLNKPYYFCSIDAEKTLKEAKWLSFLASI